MHSLDARLFLVAHLFALLSLVACARLGVPEGWSAGTVHGGRLYIGTMEGDLRALDISTGETVWRYELRGEETDRAIYGTPAVAGETLFVGGYDGILYALSLDGEEVWDTSVGNAEHIVGSPVVVDNLVLVGSSDGNLYAFDATEGSLQWTFATGNKVWSTPAVADGVAYLGSLDHNLYALKLEDGSEVWRFTAKGAITARPVVARGRVYVGTFDSVFYAVDARTGEEIWRFEEANKWYWGGALAHEDTIYAPSLDGNLYALDIDSGVLRWVLETGGPLVGSPAVIFDRIATPSLDGRLRLVRLRDGSDERQCDVGVKLRASLSVHEDFIYLAATDHTVRALRVKANGNPDVEAGPAAGRLR